jgi:hypothetical protein
MQLRPETEAALAAIDIGLSLSRRRIGADEIQSKGGRDLVTATDLAVEDAVRAALLAWRPEWTVVGEERGGEDQVGDRPHLVAGPDLRHPELRLQPAALLDQPGARRVWASDQMVRSIISARVGVRVSPGSTRRTKPRLITRERRSRRRLTSDPSTVARLSDHRNGWRPIRSSSFRSIDQTSSRPPHTPKAR